MWKINFPMHSSLLHYPEPKLYVWDDIFFFDIFFVYDVCKKNNFPHALTTGMLITNVSTISPEPCYIVRPIRCRVVYIKCNFGAECSLMAKQTFIMSSRAGERHFLTLYRDASRFHPQNCDWKIGLHKCAPGGYHTCSQLIISRSLSIAPGSPFKKVPTMRRNSLISLLVVMKIGATLHSGNGGIVSSKTVLSL